MGHDDILDELHQIREKLVRESGGDIASLFRWLREKAKEEGHETVSLAPKPPTPRATEAA